VTTAVSDDTGWLRRLMSHWRLLAVGGLVLVLAATTATLYFGQYRVDRQTAGAAATASVISAASQGSVKLLSYAPDSVDGDLAGARSYLTGNFLTYYSDFAAQFVGPAAKDRDVHATATVVRAAAAELHADKAEVLVFLNQATTSRDNPEPVQTATSVMVGLTKVDGRWLISSFDPV
jgi:Mce-associated membrane protein